MTRVCCLAGKGLDNPKGEYNCFLNVIIQSLWQLESFRDNLTQLAEARPQSSGLDSLALLKSMAHVFQLLSGSPVPKTIAPPSPAPAPVTSASGAWGARPASGGGGVWGAGGMGGARNLFVVDPAQCRAALSSIFSDQGRSQVLTLSFFPAPFPSPSLPPFLSLFPSPLSLSLFLSLSLAFSLSLFGSLCFALPFPLPFTHMIYMGVCACVYMVYIYVYAIHIYM